MQHAFVINCHKEVAQTNRLLGLLRKHFPGSRPHVYYDGPGDGGPLAALLNGAGRDGVTVAPEQPDKCRGIVQALNSLISWAHREAKAGLVSFLHPDMVPTDAAQFARFLARFEASGKALARSPMWPDHMAVSFCTLHFRLPECLPLFPIGLAGATREADYRAAGQWFNEMQATLSWDDSWPEWRDFAYPLGLMTMPHRNQFFCDGAAIDKVVHGPGFAYAVNDYCPETSVLHTHDPRFWEDADALVR